MSNDRVGLFDPFNDRLSRDLRNDLSSGLLSALASGAPAPYLTVADAYRHRPDMPPDAQDYLAKRLACYRAIVTSASPDDPDQTALQLWNHELFFEFHELLEQRWLAASGVEKEVLQGLIRAAGCYIHHRAGNTIGAEKMAARARATITKYREQLPRGFAAAALLAGLADPNNPPPRFGPIVRGRTGTRCKHDLS